MLKKLHEKSEIWFAVVWIIIYCVGASACDQLSNRFGFEKLFTLGLMIVMSIVMFIIVKKNNWMEYYGLCRVKKPAGIFLYYIPMIIIFSINLWVGPMANGDMLHGIVYITYMLLVGFVEELIFRGFLFKAMQRDNLVTAIIVSSVTFGLGHIANFFNGNADLFPTILQMCYAVAIGYLFVVIMWKGKSMIPCIIAHSVNNALSFFTNSQAMTKELSIIFSAILCILPLAYAFYILWRAKKIEMKQIVGVNE